MDDVRISDAAGIDTSVGSDRRRVVCPAAGWDSADGFCGQWECGKTRSGDTDLDRHDSAPDRRRQRRGVLGLDARSEEHTSELQSHLNLVCPLLLEKKKHN